MGVYRFEDLRVWQAANGFAGEIRAVLRQMTESKDFALADQLNRAAVSTVANIAEGFVRRGRRDFTRFVRIAAASNAEARALIHVARARGYLQQRDYERLVESTNAIGRMLSALSRSLATQDGTRRP